MHPIIAALKHHKTAVILVALEIALTCAIVTNALSIIGSHLTSMRMPTGIADNALVWARSSGLRDDSTAASQASVQAADLAALRSMPGVKSVIMTNTLPLAHNYSAGGVYRDADDKDPVIKNAVTYLGTRGMVATLGIKIREGRDFLPQEYESYDAFSAAPPPAVVIITRALADKMWPGEDPLGKPIFIYRQTGKAVTRVVGVTAHLLNPTINKDHGAELNMLFPVTSVDGGMYVLRTDPTARDAVLKDLPGVLDSIDDQRIITKSQLYAQTVSDYYHDDRALVWLLLVVICCLLALTALGVVGLSSFWVQQRTRQIGIRRAIGATRGDILRYFHVENFLIVSVGIAFGSLGALLLNLLLMQHYELPRLPLYYLPIGAVVLWVLGQLAVLGPAFRAAAVPPVVATRSV